ncbi:MAG: hypothetical protein AB1772_03870 [Candidatus Zixiibacteriota bacterium]
MRTGGYLWLRRSISIVVLVAATVFLVVSCGQTDHTARIEMHKRLAGEMVSNGLHAEAVAEYEKVLLFGDLTDAERGNVNYLIARVYYEHLRDYEKAAAHYIRAREYDPDGSFAGEASKNLVASLEKLGRVLDAKRHLAAATNIEPQPEATDDPVVARIGDRDIRISEINNHIALLPAEIQSQLASREARQKYVHQYVGVELLYNAAVREDYLSKPEVQREREQLEKRLVVDRFISDNVIPDIKIDTADLRNFYLANKDSLYDGAPFDSVRSQVYIDYRTRKAEAAYNDYIMSLVQAEKVQFFDQNVK